MRNRFDRGRCKKVKTTIRDVARRAGVSASTVSHVVNGTRFVSPDTERRVRLAIGELGFRSNSLARGLRRHETRSLGLLVPDIANPFFAEMGRLIEDMGFSQGYNVILCNSDMSPVKEAAYVDTLLSKQADGLIFISSGHDRDILEGIVAAGIAAVIVDREIEGLAVDSVLVDNELGGYAAGHHLLDLGHRVIAVITGPSDVTPSAHRLDGYVRALRDHGTEGVRDAVVRGDFRFESSRRATEELLQRDLGITAIFAMNDLMAMGALSALHEARIRVPDDVSVVGFDDIFLTGAMYPTLTTVAQPIERVARTAVGLLLQRIQNPNIPARRIVLEPTLVLRESTGPPPGASGVRIPPGTDLQ